jgi:hypothetical protein
MKATLLAIVSLVLGSAIGYWLTQREFAHDVLPLEITPAASSPGHKIGPKVAVINGERFDFGTMDRDGHLSHVFEIRNDGDEPLTLTKGNTTCKCTLSELDRNSLAPGEKALVTLEWDAKTSDTSFEQSAEINTNDPRRPTIYLSIVGRVLDTVRLERSDVHFHDILTSDSPTAVLNIYAFRNPDLEVEKVDFNNATIQDHFSVSFAPLPAEEVAKAPDAKGGLKMTIAIKPGLPIGSFEQGIQITTNQNEQTALTVNVYGNVVSDILLAGPSVVADRLLVSLGTRSRDEGVMHTVYLLVKGPHRDDTQLKIDSYEPTVEFAARLGEPLRDNPKIVRWPLTIEIPPGATPVSHLSEGAYGQIRLSTTHPAAKELTIKVRYGIKE